LTFDLDSLDPTPYVHKISTRCAANAVKTIPYLSHRGGQRTVCASVEHSFDCKLCTAYRAVEHSM